MIVDSSVSAEHSTGNGIHPQMMPDISAKTGSLDGTKECVSKCLCDQKCFKQKNADSFREHGAFCICLLFGTENWEARPRGHNFLNESNSTGVSSFLNDQTIILTFGTSQIPCTSYFFCQFDSLISAEHPEEFFPRGSGSSTQFEANFSTWFQYAHRFIYGRVFCSQRVFRFP